MRHESALKMRLTEVELQFATQGRVVQNTLEKVYELGEKLKSPFDFFSHATSGTLSDALSAPGTSIFFGTSSSSASSSSSSSSSAT